MRERLRKQKRRVLRLRLIVPWAAAGRPMQKWRSGERAASVLWLCPVTPDGFWLHARLIGLIHSASGGRRLLLILGADVDGDTHHFGQP